METLNVFFEGYTAGELILMVVTAAVFIIPGIGVKLLNWAKESLGLAGEKAHYFILALLVALSLAAMFVTGMFLDVTWDLKTMVSQVMAALVPAKLAYKKLKLSASPGFDPPNVTGPALDDSPPVDGGR